MKKGWLVENLMTIVKIVPPGVPSLNDDIARLHKQVMIAIRAKFIFKKKFEKKILRV